MTVSVSQITGHLNGVQSLPRHMKPAASTLFVAHPGDRSQIFDVGVLTGNSQGTVSLHRRTPGEVVCLRLPLAPVPRKIRQFSKDSAPLVRVVLRH